MSGQVPTREQLAELAALETTPGPWREAITKRRESGALTPGRIRAAVLAALAEVHVAAPLWGDTVADDVLARLQAQTSKASAPQPDPLPAEGDVWAELIDGEPVAELRALYRERRALGIERYGVPLQRGNGRHHRADLLQELLDGMAYAQAADLPGVVAALREQLQALSGGAPPRAWVVQLEPGVWLAPWEGDPGRTCERSSARQFGSERAALRALEQARRFRKLPVAVVEVAWPPSRSA